MKIIYEFDNKYECPFLYDETGRCCLESNKNYISCVVQGDDNLDNCLLKYQKIIEIIN